MRRAEVLAILHQHLPDLRRRFGVRALSVFGSVARDEASQRSDVDIVVDFEGRATFDGYFGLKEALEEILDLATREMLKPRLKLQVEREAVHVA
jgi:predicted nucleotidyltransferase